MYLGVYVQAQTVKCSLDGDMWHVKHAKDI